MALVPVICAVYIGLASLGEILGATAGIADAYLRALIKFEIPSFPVPDLLLPCAWRERARPIILSLSGDACYGLRRLDYRGCQDEVANALSVFCQDAPDGIARVL